MPKLPVITPKRLLAILKKNNFVIDHISGSHYILYNKYKNLRVTVPFHRKDIPKGTLLTIIKSSGLLKKDIK